MDQADMKEYSLTVAAQLENEKAKKKNKGELENAMNAKSLSSPSTNTNKKIQSQKDELRKGLAEGVMYKQLQKVNLI